MLQPSCWERPWAQGRTKRELSSSCQKYRGIEIILHAVGCTSRNESSPGKGRLFTHSCIHSFIHSSSPSFSGAQPNLGRTLSLPRSCLNTLSTSASYVWYVPVREGVETCREIGRPVWTSGMPGQCEDEAGGPLGHLLLLLRTCPEASSAEDLNCKASSESPGSIS